MNLINEMFPGLKLSKAQEKIVISLANRGVIGEFQDGKTARFELFSAPLNGDTKQRELRTILSASF